MFEGQPKGLWALALANTGERFGYYTMIAVFALFLRANFGLSAGVAGTIYSSFLMFVYFFPLIGGMLADKFGFGKMVTTGIIVMFLGYLLLSIPLGGVDKATGQTDMVAMGVMIAALLLIGFGTGLFKGNLQVMVGNLYDDPAYAAKRDDGFSLFYMAINIGALFAPTAATRIKDWAENFLGFEGNDAYHFSFAVACVSLIVSIAIYYIFRFTFRHVEGGKRTAAAAAQQNVPELSVKETKERMIALVLVYAVIIFFWMAFHQNGLSLTYFANEFTAQSSSGLESMWFDVFNLVMIILIIYAGFSLRDAKTGKAKAICWGIIAFSIIILVGKYLTLEGEVAVSAPIFQHFNPFYVVALTPFSMALFAYLGKKGKAPSAPRKIAWGMIIAAFAFFVLAAFSVGLPQPQTEMGPDGYQVAKHVADQTPYLLIGTYLILTFAELLLSPMGISFVTKVAPPKYKGMMMGGWFVATAIGNQLVMVGGLLWGPLPLWAVWSVFIALCLLAALFMFAIMKRLEKVAK